MVGKNARRNRGWGHPIRRHRRNEYTNFLLLTVLFYREVIGFQAGYRLTLLVRHHHIHHDEAGLRWQGYGWDTGRLWSGRVTAKGGQPLNKPERGRHHQEKQRAGMGCPLPSALYA